MKRATSLPELTWPVLGAVVGIFIFMAWLLFQVGLWFAGRETNFAWSAYWFGDLGAFGLLVNLGTLGLAAIGGLSIIWTIRHNTEALAQSRDSERSNRFQKGAELLFAVQGEAPMAGVVLTLQAAQEDPERYYAASLVMLSGAVNQVSRPLADSATGAHPDNWPETPARAAFALAALGNALSARVLIEAEHPGATLAGLLNTDGRFAVEAIYLSNRIIAVGSSLANTLSFNVFLNRVAFKNVDFTNAFWQATAGYTVLFDGCNMDRADLTIRAAVASNAALQPSHTGVVMFRNIRNAHTAQLNGMPLTEWIEQSHKE